ncbi:MAG TPA: TraR/DksA C4-type zinc finger protein [Solirubrobacterales bacterium]|nr:TraR/DksA C4-type zinc finger protein [Solirubrobacterales bacterium]
MAEPHPDPPDAAAIGATLGERLGEVRERLAALKKPPERGSGIGFGKRIGDGTSEAIDRLSDVGVADSLEAIEARLERALEKLEDGSYGTCDGCGAALPAGRLRSVPESALCLDCARK